MAEHRMYGMWESPVSPASLAGSLRLSEPCWDTDGRTLAWIEGRSDRGVLVVQRHGDAPRDLTSDISVRAFVGYGGGDFTLSKGVAYFVGQSDQRIYRQSLAGGTARPITPPFGATSTPSVSPDGAWVAYVHTFEGDDCIAVVDCEGKNWPWRLATGRDFYTQPAWSPDGSRLAWTEWDYPNMPWDGTEVRVAQFDGLGGDNLSLLASEVVAGGSEISCTHPIFGHDGSLYYVSDETGWGQVYCLPIGGGEAALISDGGAEYGGPAWGCVERLAAPLPSGGVVAIRQESGFATLVQIDEQGTRPVAGFSGFTSIVDPVVSPLGDRVAAVASSPVVPPRVITATLSPDDEGEVRRYGASETVTEDALSRPEAISWKSFDGEDAHGLYYPPASDQFTCDGPAPLVVLVHGGPTSQAGASWNAQVQFLATRGYGVLLVNYRGSTGYGRDYMLKLRDSWGIYDVEDSRSGAASLVDEGRADGSRIVIMGGSAGGFTVLQSLVKFPGFYRAAACLYGVSNLFALAQETHKFEARYLDLLLGSLPEAAGIYRERSPIFHCDRIVDPIAVFQGDIDRVVPREQSDSIIASLKARGVPHEYHVYEGEGHGWRRAETIESFYVSLESFLRQAVLFS